MRHVRCNDCMTVMVETDDQCGRDDCLMSDFTPSDADVMWEG